MRSDGLVLLHEGIGACGEVGRTLMLMLMAMLMLVLTAVLRAGGRRIRVRFIAVLAEGKLWILGGPAVGKKGLDTVCARGREKTDSAHEFRIYCTDLREGRRP